MKNLKKNLLIVFVFIFSFVSTNISYAISDNTLPNTISDLSISSVGTSTVLLSWTAPGDYRESLKSEYVIIISVDGLGSEYIKPLLTPGDNQLVNIKRLIDEGAGTLNARNDADYAVTLPNHVSMITGRGVSGSGGHAWTENVDPGTSTIASKKGSYVSSVFDVVHDSGSTTAVWSGKSKFSLLQQSYSSTTGALDLIGLDNGRDKIDYDYVNNGVSAQTLTSDFIDKMTNNFYNLSFVHFQNPDAQGHSTSWSTDRNSAFASTSKAVDIQIGNIIDFVENNSTLNGKTTIILTADHGGHSNTHGDISNYLDYTIPFLVWGAGVKTGVDLYSLNLDSRLAPATSSNPTYTGSQPIRNVDAANLALDFLGLSSIPNSAVNFEQNLITQNLENVSVYDIRYGTSSITNDTWAQLFQVNNEPTPASIGGLENFEINGLLENTNYNFSIKSSDNSSNFSNISNVVSSTTHITPQVIIPQTSNTVSRGGGGGGGGTRAIISDKTPMTAQDLVKKIEELKAQLALLTNQPTNTTLLSSCPNMEYGYIGECAKSLQIFLNKNGFIVADTGPGSKGNETKRFGQATRNALIKFQTQNKIIPSVGYFGPVTKAVMKAKGFIK